MKRMISIIALLLALLMIVPVAVADEAYTIQEVIPGDLDWGLSRTKFKSTYDADFQDIEIEGFKSLTLPSIVIEGLPMAGYYVFGLSQGSYNGLSKVIYLVDVSTKLTTDEINYCLDVLTDSMLALADPDSSNKTKNVWYGDQVTIEISTGTYKDLNGSKNKTVALTFTMPEAAKAQATAKPTAKPTEKPTKKPSTKAKTMEVDATATCSDYNSVGNNWTYVFYVNGKKIGANSKVELTAGDEITVKAIVTENDKSPDVGTNNSKHTVTEKEIKDGFTINFNVKVRENKGRYTGNTATWKISYKFAPAK